ncbi:MAG TPA: glycogen debranching protein GlgX [Gammaproteobacteria bacterium]|nr:glycogen debranching protein GlgX [Gammaproteobacteria bacterium]
MEPGSPYPLGASWDGSGVNFALFSAHADKVELCLFDDTGRHEIERINLPAHTDEVWHGYLPTASPGLLYGYRVYGPYEPAHGHRFNPHNLLLDPYARSLHGELKPSPAHFAYRLGSARADQSFDRRDNAHAMPKCRVVDTAFTWGEDRRPQTPWSDTVIYELNVRGYTMTHPDVPNSERGTFAGLARAEVIDSIASLGVTAVELLPVQSFVDENHLLDRRLRNFWGYNTIGFFSPAQRYLAGERIEEFKTFVKRFHAAGIEVILDVVYNHTAEGDQLGQTLSFRGIDNPSYYRLTDDGHYLNWSGCGNTLNLTHPRVLQMVMDSLRYWAEDMHVDGFRFDLGTALGREARDFDPGSGFFDAVRQDPVLSRLKLIAEPWDVGPDGYRLGGFPPGWSEWNDRFRDTLRGFWRGDPGFMREMGARLTGSSDLFEHHGRRTWASINFVAAHDGFTLGDLVTFEERHNEANHENNADGHSDNLSANYGIEGPTDDDAVNALRERQKRNLLATLLISQGVPMLLAGDEHGNSQGGNNNAYCQDNDIGWLNWDRIDDAGWSLRTFVRRLIALRRLYPMLRQPGFLHGEPCSNGHKNITWYKPAGTEKQSHDWDNPPARCIGMQLNGASVQDAAHSDEPEASLFVILNGDIQTVGFKLPPVPPPDAGWHPINGINGDIPDFEKNGDIPDFGSRNQECPHFPPHFPPGEILQVPGRTVLIFASRPRA